MSAPENPPAFPVAWDTPNAPEPGMSLRDWFAGQALAGDLASQSPDSEWPNIAGDQVIRERARFLYRFADAMLAERAKGIAA